MDKASTTARLLWASLLVSERHAPTSELRPDGDDLGLSEEGYIEWACLVQRRDQLLADVEAWAGEVA
jgi:hypothetical protein